MACSKEVILSESYADRKESEYNFLIVCVVVGILNINRSRCFHQKSMEVMAQKR